MHGTDEAADSAEEESCGTEGQFRVGGAHFAKISKSVKSAPVSNSKITVPVDHGSRL